MSLPSLLPIGSAALGLLASKALSGLSDGLSFKSLLAGNQAGNSNENAAATAGTSQAKVSLNLSEALPQFVSKLRDRLQAAGVDLSQPLTLKEDGRGGVLVEGEHPNWTTIEQLLAQDPELSAEFQAIATAAAEKRQSVPLGMDHSLGEFRLALVDQTATIRFE